jgi:hypothetical protein
MQIGPEVEIMRITTRERFERKVLPWFEPNGCQLWIGTINKQSGGHGRFYLNKKYPTAHRVSYELYVGPIPNDMQVLHKCDNPPCVNPDHLFLGTQQDNIADMGAKGRKKVFHGIEHGMAKINPEKAFEIRWLHASGYSSRKLAAMYDVSKRTIQNVYQNKLWQQECHD